MGNFLGAAYKGPAVDSAPGGEAALSPAELGTLGAVCTSPTQLCLVIVPNLALEPQPGTL